MPGETITRRRYDLTRFVGLSADRSFRFENAIVDADSFRMADAQSRVVIEPYWQGLRGDVRTCHVEHDGILPASQLHGSASVRHHSEPRDFLALRFACCCLHADRRCRGDLQADVRGTDLLRVCCCVFLVGVLFLLLVLHVELAASRLAFLLHRRSLFTPRGLCCCSLGCFGVVFFQHLVGFVAFLDFFVFHVARRRSDFRVIFRLAHQ